jgi:hypothetical protein
MSLETATFISQLDAANPAGSDPIAAGDDHLRLIKSTLKNTFPNVTGAVSKSHTDLNNALDKRGDTMTGALVLAGDPSAALGAATKQYVDSIVFAAKQALFPIGSIYTNATNSTNPSSLLGFGTWVSFGAGRMPVGYDAGDSNFNAAEKTGGSKDAVVVDHTHTITASSATSGYHYHAAGRDDTNNGTKYYGIYTGISGPTNQGTFWNGSGGGLGNGSQAAPTTGNIVTSYAVASSSGGDGHSHTVTATAANTGVAGTDKNLPPFITVYMWKRTA